MATFPTNCPHPNPLPKREGTKSPRLVFHADDLGMNRAVNEGILRGFRAGLLTSTALLANAPDAGWALQQWKTLSAGHAAGQIPSVVARKRLDDPDCPFDLGVHLNLTQGRPLTGKRYPAELLDPDGRFPGVLALFLRLRRHVDRFHTAIRVELDEQIQFVREQGLQPTHLNGHQYVEMMPGLGGIVEKLSTQFGIRTVRVAWERGLMRSTVLRGQFWKWPLACAKRVFAERFRTRMDESGIRHPAVFFGTSHAGGVDMGLLRVFLASARNKRLVEVGLHPGEVSSSTLPHDQANGWHDPLADARPKELQMLVSAALVDCLESMGWRLGRLSVL